MELTQKGYKVDGVFTAKSTFYKNGVKKEEEHSNLYKLRGHISDHYVVMEYSPLSRKRTGLGAFVLEVKEGGKKMQGSISFVEELDMEVSSFGNIILHRTDNQ